MHTPKRKAYYTFALILLVLLVGWEYDRVHANIGQGAIPEEAIRLRILAHSDQMGDQWVKLKVRDAVIQYMRAYMTDTTALEDARSLIRLHQREIEQVIGATLRQYGFSYGFTAELDTVPFPTKVYGSRVYPEGDYEALRITLGSGSGQNWWCVLFPPLCLVDLVTEPVVEGVQGEPQDETAVTDVQQQGDNLPEVRFFLLDRIGELKESVSNWFS